MVVKWIFENIIVKISIFIFFIISQLFLFFSLLNIAIIAPSRSHESLQRRKKKGHLQIDPHRDRHTHSIIIKRFSLKDIHEN